jgi:multidrug efflux pump subunit AcrA (membrane-fusion protein)
MKRIAIAAGIAALVAIAAGPAQAIDWLHVHVDENGADPTKVRVNVPVSMVQAILPVIEEDDFYHGRVRIDKDDIDGVYVRAILKAVSEAEEGEYITVESWNKGTREEVRVAKRGGDLLIKVREEGENPATVDIKMPITVAEALISGKENELDVLAAVEALGKAGRGEIIVTDSEDDTMVRVWVDQTSSPKKI